MHKALALGFAVANGKAPGPKSGSLKPEVQIRKPAFRSQTGRQPQRAPVARNKTGGFCFVHKVGTWQMGSHPGPNSGSLKSEVQNRKSKFKPGTRMPQFGS